MRLFVSLFAVSVFLLGLTVWPTCSPDAVQAGERPVGLECERPATLSLRRFEDGSAWLRCAGRTLARISVPG